MTHKTDVLVYGAGGHGRVVLDAVLSASALRVVGVLDDDPAQSGRCVLGVQIVGGASVLSEPRLHRCLVVVAIGDPEGRERAVARVAAAGLGFVCVIHPTAFIARGVSLAEGAMILPMAVVHTGASVGRHAIVNSGAIVEHDCRIGDFAHISPGVCLAGDVVVGRGSLVGIGASVAPGIRVGENAVVGAGASVINDVPPGIVVAGVPARPLRQESS